MAINPSPTHPVIDPRDGALGEAVEGVLGLLQFLDLRRRQAGVEAA
jgi:hypothetical protein